MDLSLLPEGLTHGKEPPPGRDEDTAPSPSPTLPREVAGTETGQK